MSTREERKAKGIILGMVIEYNHCDTCHHALTAHPKGGACSIRDCGCTRFKPHGSTSMNTVIRMMTGRMPVLLWVHPLTARA